MSLQVLATSLLVMQRQRSVSTVRQRLMSTAVTFSAGCVLVGGHRDLRSLGITDCPVTAMTVTRCDGRDITGGRYPPYLYRPVMQVVRRGRYSPCFPWVWGVPGLLPVPLVAAGFCDRAGVSGTGASPGWRSRRPTCIGR